VQIYLLPAFGKFALTDITDVAISRLYKSWRKEEYAPATISFAHVLLGNIFKLALRRGLILVNPMNNVEPPAKPKPKPVAMNPEQSQKFLDAASTRQEGFMFRLAYFLGARPCEYLALQWGDIDWQAKRVTLQRSLKLRRGNQWYTTPPKTEKSVRSIVLTDAFVKALDEHRRRQLEARLKAGAN
jgi:integrase